ncbi:MAG: PIG-L family deacetylase [Eubacteriales bacterium]|nr:PIG-L family deacetylase [Eubacteriales bacterium]
MKIILFISVHPDDETLGCGGTILHHRANGDSIHWLNITGPTPNHPYGFSKETVEHRLLQVQKVAEAYGFESFTQLPCPTQMLESVEPRLLVGEIFKVFKSIQPEWIYSVNRSDIHSDHRVAFQAVYAATKNFRSPFIKKHLLYETLSETEFSPALAENSFIPNFFVDISSFMETKIEIMNIYDTELMPDPMPRSVHAIRALAAYRGSRIGVNYAEAFMNIFEVYP